MVGELPDLREQDVAFDFEGDPQCTWRSHILLSRVNDLGLWLVMTPGDALQVVDVRRHNLVALARGGPVPARLRGNLYGFGALAEEALGGRSPRRPSPGRHSWRGRRGPWCSPPGQLALRRHGARALW